MDERVNYVQPMHLTSECIQYEHVSCPYELSYVLMYSTLVYKKRYSETRLEVQKPNLYEV